MKEVALLPGVAMFLVLGAATLLLLAFRRASPQEIRQEQQLFIFAFVLRFALSVAIYQFGLVKVVGDEDASGWESGAKLLEWWQNHGVSPLQLPFVMMEAFEGKNRGYYYLLGGWFYITGCPGRLPAAALNCFLGAMTVVLTYRIAHTLFSEWVAMQTARWICFLPSLVLWSAMTLKEPVIIFLEIVALYGCIRLRSSHSPAKNLLLCAATVILLLPFRFYASYIVGLAVVVALAVPSVQKPKSISSGLMLVALLVGLVAGTGVFAKREAEVQMLDLNYIQNFRTNVSSGVGSGSGVKTADIRTSGGLASGIAVGAAHLLLAPFPWQLGGGSMRMVLTLPELLFWWWLFFVGLIPGVAYCLRHRLNQIMPMLVFIAGFGLLYSLMFGNVGLVMRQRAQLLPWLLIIAAVGLELRARRLAATAKAIERSTPVGATG